jgi:hypothetical protein
VVWFALLHIFSAILELLRVGRLSEKDKDLEIMILRHQLDVMTRLQTKSVKPNRAEKLTLAVLTKNLSFGTVRHECLDQILIFNESHFPLHNLLRN